MTYFPYQVLKSNRCLIFVKSSNQDKIPNQANVGQVLRDRAFGIIQPFNAIDFLPICENSKAITQRKKVRLRIIYPIDS